MTEFSNDDSRLRAAEEQMRRALGLRDQASAPQPPPVARPAQTPNGSHRPHRRFVRDGEVPVEVVHHEGSGTNQLESAREAIRTLTTVREQTERQLAEAQATIRDLQTKLAHERIARDEAVQRAAAEGEDTDKALQLAKAELDAERAARFASEEKLAATLERCAAAEQRVEQLKQPELVLANSDNAESKHSEASAQPEKPGRRRGRPPKARAPEPEPDFVEWWKPGWQEQFR